MPVLRDFLRRWRPAAAPGAAARSGVPDDRPAGAEAEEELAEVFGALEPVRTECRVIADAARHEADQVRARAREQAEAILAEARAAAPVARAGAIEQARADSEAEQATIVAEAEQRAADIRQHAADRMPVMVGRVVELLERELR
jgi:vacuolar-type H+-ATPase subunit H